MTPATLYRKLLKLYISRFTTDVDTIVKSWRQTKFEFDQNRNVSKEDATAYIVRGQQIYHAIRASVVPLCYDPKTGRKYARYDKDLLEACGGNVDPISPEEFIRRYHDRLDKDDVSDIVDRLKKTGRWDGPEELRAEDVMKIKTKRQRVKCTDPDPDDTPIQDSAPAAGGDGGEQKAGTGSNNQPKMC